MAHRPFTVTTMAALLALALSSAASAAEVRLLAVNPTAVQVSVDGGPPQMLPLGQSINGMTAVDTSSKAADFRIDGKIVRVERGQLVARHASDQKPPKSSTPADAPAPGSASGFAPNQPPGFFCPVGWQPNPSGELRRDGGFRCEGAQTSTIPPGWSCPAGMTLVDHSKTSMLICKRS